LHLSAKGQLLRGRWMFTRDGNIGLTAKLERTPDGQYAYQREVGDESLRGRFQAPKGIPTPLDIAALLKKKLETGGPFTATVSAYDPTVEPKGLIAVTFSRPANAPDREVHKRFADQTFSANVDENGLGSLAWVELPQGKMTITRERIAGQL